jgi:multimeric flavodoxin WrbA
VRVLGIAGSPRGEGNSACLLDLALATATERGDRVERLWLRKLDIKPCTACDGCRRGPACIVRDDMHRVYAELHHADVVVVATPVYFYDMSAWVKVVLDRTYALTDVHDQPRLPAGKKLYVVTTQEDPDPALGGDVVRTLRRAFAWSGLEFAGSLVAFGLSGPDEWRDHPKYIEAAKALLA